VPRSGVLCALGLIPLLLAALAAPSRSEPVISLASVAWVQRPLRPGSVGVVRLAVASFSDASLLDSTATVECSGCCRLAGGGTFPLGALSVGAAKSLDVAVNFTGRCACTIRVLVHYRSTARQTALGYVVDRSPGVAASEVTLEPAFQPYVEVSIRATGLTVGAAGNLTLVLTNRGGADAVSLSASITASGAAIIGPAPLTVDLGPLRVGESREVPISVLPLSSLVTLSVSLRYADEYGFYSEGAVSYALTASSGTVLVQLEPRTVPASSSSRVELVVRNLGDDALRGATLYLGAQPGSSVTIEPATLGLGDIPPRSEVRREVVVRVPYGEIGARSIPYTLVYTGGDGTQRVVRDSLSVVAVEVARLAVTSVEVAPSRPVAGALATLTVTLMNLGSAPLYGVNVSILLPPGLEAARGTSYFLGQLSPYTPTAVPFSLRPSEPGEYSVRIVVAYRGYYGEELSLERSLKIVVERAQQAAASGERPGGGWALALAAAAALSVVAAAVLRRRGRGV